MFYEIHPEFLCYIDSKGYWLLQFVIVLMVDGKIPKVFYNFIKGMLPQRKTMLEK